MLEDFLQRRPYNAVTDLMDAQVARGLGGKIAFTDADRSLTYGELQARTCRVCRGAAGSRAAAGRAARSSALRHGRFSGGVLGRRARRHRGAAAQHAAHRGAVRLHSRRQPRGGDRRRRRRWRKRSSRSSIGCRVCARLFSSARAPRTKPPSPAATFTISPICWRAADRMCSRRRPCPTKSRSGCTRPARPAIPRASSTSTPRRWRRRG